MEALATAQTTRDAARMRHAFVLIALVSACSQPAPQRVQCSARPGATLEQVIAADNARDVDAVMGNYTDDITWIPPSRAVMSGADAIRASYESMYADFDPALTIIIEATSNDGRLANVRGRTGGRLTPRREGVAPVAVNDHYLATLRCEEGAWRIESMMWGPAPAP
jgi:ketosteroid isomerase-like protein